MRNKNIILTILFGVFLPFTAGCRNTSEITAPSFAPCYTQGNTNEGSKSKDTSVPDAGKSMVTAITDKNEKDSLRITAVGDIMLGRGVGNRLVGMGQDYTYPFTRVKEVLKRGDIVFGNLEVPFTNCGHSLKGIEEGGKYVLKSSEASAEGVIYAGFNLLNLANNHIMDYYDAGLFDTMRILDKNNIVYAGAGKDLNNAMKPGIIEKKGLKIGLLSYTEMAELLYDGDPQLVFAAGEGKAGVASLEPAGIIREIEKLKGKVDIILVSLHWGIEESFTIASQQKELAHRLLDSGADVILGHHPHQFQGIEIYKGKPVVYSMGNFIFDQNDPENQEGFILDMVYSGRKLKSFSAIPFRIEGKTRIVPLAAEDAKELLEREVMMSSKLGAQCMEKDGKLVYTIE